MLAVALARRGHEVVGVDPSAEMLSVARQRPGGELVTWLHGDATATDAGRFDLAVLTGHVAQVISDDADWRRTVAGVRRALRPGGRIAFESRDPAARGWERWNPQASRRTLPGPVDVWCSGTHVDGGLVRYQIHYLFASGEEVLSHTVLRFRSREELTQALTDAGFTVEHVYGDWDGRPVGPELIVVAVAQ